MSNAVYICYMALLAVFGWLCYRFGFVAGWLCYRFGFVAGWLCYRFGFVAGWIEELVKIVDLSSTIRAPMIRIMRRATNELLF